ncbi:MAG: Translation initiation factor IF-3 [candidate division WS6 bacterium OLB20]|uniref:Translation initiation factor IF-3 n=1 Tax=candidate division WS6 bacterium OLB20 TaxID=1617426 RepID=A0A136LXZ7_9BACT|nr:MAG: Translation initiation factor IF-3 [candidate division WS6 bacterium OLB20]
MKREEVRYARNEFIKAPRLLVIDADGTQLGEIDTEKALAIARERELDLIEVAPNANPPVAKIYDWSKFKYQQDKKRKENKSKSIEQKEMWFKSFIDTGDMLHKIKKVKEFLEKKHPVKITIRGKGRVTRDHMYQVMDEILAELEGYIKYDGRPKLSGRNMSLIVRPDINKKTNEKEQDQNT